jgi:hypothetical protein
MSWLRVDDAAGLSPKLARLTDNELRALVFGVWSYCCRNPKTDGTFTLDDLPAMVYLTPDGPATVTTEQAAVFARFGLTDPRKDGRTFEVHDWHQYRPKDPTAADRMRRYRSRNDEPSTNG